MAGVVEPCVPQGLSSLGEAASGYRDRAPSIPPCPSELFQESCVSRIGRWAEGAHLRSLGTRINFATVLINAL